MIDIILRDNGSYIHVIDQYRLDLHIVKQYSGNMHDRSFYSVGSVPQYSGYDLPIYISSAIDLEIMGRYLDLKTFDCGMPAGTHKPGYVWLYDDNKEYRSHMGKAFDLQSAFNRRILEVVQERMNADV